MERKGTGKGKKKGEEEKENKRARKMRSGELLLKKHQIREKVNS